MRFLCARERRANGAGGQRQHHSGNDRAGGGNRGRFHFHGQPYPQRKSPGHSFGDRIAMESSLTSLSFVEKAYHFQSINSTNTFAKSLVCLPANGICVITADRQTAGRGQRDNTFFSGTDGGLYASIVCPISDIQSHFMYNRAISLAICHAIEGKVPLSLVRIKWPNDIYWSDRKICGILLESLP